MGGGLEEEKGQWEFLEKSLPAKGGEAVVVLTHYPPFVSKIDEADAYWNMNKAPRERLMGLLAAAGVKTVFSGHLHRPIEYTAGGVHVIGAPAVSFGLPRGKQPEGWVLVRVGEGGKCEGELKYLPMDAATKPAGK
jgi:3',5'-cyclic AMP phosphodiesterase CpdA